MSQNDPGLRGVLAELAEKERERLGATITVDDLLAYRRGELAEPVAERVRDLLAADPEWAELYLDLGRTEPLEAAGADASDEVIGDEWRRFERPLEPGGRLLRFRRLVADYPLSAVAASFLLAFVSAAGLLRAPGPPPVTGRIFQVQLEPEGEASQQRQGEEEPAARADTQQVMISLLAPTASSLGREPPARCRFELRQGARMVARDLAELQDGVYLLVLRPSALEPGEVEIRLFDDGPPAAGLFATYHFRFRRSP